MSDNKFIFFRIAEYFGVFSLCSEQDVDYLRSIYKDKDQLRDSIKEMIMESDDKLKSITKVELFCLLTEFLFNKCTSITNIEVCSLYSIFWDTLKLSFRKHSKKETYDYFKKSLIKFSMDRPPYQIGILQKITLECLTSFFINNIYTKYEFLTYMMCKKKNVDILTKDMMEIRLPHVLDLNLATEALPRNVKIIKQYTENRKPKTDLEQKIEIILEFERTNLDNRLEDKFLIQDQVFNKKLDELLSKRKK